MNESGRIPEKMVKQKTANHFQQIGQKMVCGFSLQFRKGTADRIYVYRVH